MELTNEFRVPIPRAQAWATLTDLETIAPCMPGAELTEVDGDDYRGIVKVKLGPMTAQYKGTAHFAERDDEAFRAVIQADGRDTRGQGSASATITAELSEDGDKTVVSLTTDLTITGKVAQFGRGVLADVTDTLLGEFVSNLESTVLGGGADQEAPPEPAEQTETGASSGPDGQVAAPSATARRPTAEPVDLMQVAGAPVAKRIVPIGIVVLVLVLVLWRRRRNQ